MSLDTFDWAGVRLLDGALDFAELGKVRQAFEILESEQFEELRRGFVNHRAPWRFLASSNFYQAFFEQRFEHAAGIDAAQLFYLGARDRLPIGDDRDGFHQRAAESRRPRGEQLAHVAGVVLWRAHLVAAGDFVDDDAAIFGRVLRRHL